MHSLNLMVAQSRAADLQQAADRHRVASQVRRSTANRRAHQISSVLRRLTRRIHRTQGGHAQ